MKKIIVFIAFFYSLLAIGTNANAQAKLSHNYTIECQGSCSQNPSSAEQGLCGMSGNAQAITCACNNCKMVVTQISTKSVSNTPPVIKELPDLMAALSAHILETQGTEKYVINSINYQKDETYTVTTFIYVTEGGKEGSVMYATHKNGTTREINCSGSQCDCREKFVFGDIPHAECTCQQDCSMTVKEIKIK